MGDINRILIGLILIGLIIALYKYQDIIVENFGNIQQSLGISQSIPQQLPPSSSPPQQITSDNISQISIPTFDNSPLDSLATFSDNDSKQTFGSLFDD